jgi:hypothetical protein
MFPGMGCAAEAWGGTALARVDLQRERSITNPIDSQAIISAGLAAEVRLGCITVRDIGAFSAEPVKGLYHIETSDGTKV